MTDREIEIKVAKLAGIKALMGVNRLWKLLDADGKTVSIRQETSERAAWELNTPHYLDRAEAYMALFVLGMERFKTADIEGYTEAFDCNPYTVRFGAGRHNTYMGISSGIDLGRAIVEAFIAACEAQTPVNEG